MCIAVTGASGFVGRHLLETLVRNRNIRVRGLTRSAAIHQPVPSVEYITGDLLAADSWRQLLVPDGALVNLAYSDRAPLDDYREALAVMVDACVERGIRRLVHVSTAVVAGHTAATRVDEDTPCEPGSEYERRKYALEGELLERCRERVCLIILRPTAVFGLGGRNLVRMLQDLTVGPRWKAWLKSSLYDQRRMNLLSVDNLVAAIQHALADEALACGGHYIVADDDQPGNRYRAIEQRVMQRLGIPDYRLPRLPLAAPLLHLLLRLRGRSNSDPQRSYDGARLLASGCARAVSLDEALNAFIDDYGREQGLAGG